MSFGDRLSEERKRTGMNQTKFGEVGGVTKTAQVNYESGKRSPDVDYWQAIAELGVDVQYILTGNRASAHAVNEHKADYNKEARMRRADDKNLAAMSELLDGLNDVQRKEICAAIEKKKHLNKLTETVNLLVKKLG